MARLPLAGAGVSWPESRLWPASSKRRDRAAKSWTGGMAEREGFEPSIRFCRILTFQASAFDHSATAPFRRSDAP